ncbi:uncharacterized protein LOC106081971 [Stomoxys calcitrans]|uniref:uncharacterized protein LOC106081971 n=1 Tax=Stomoxys calcitrans TaxID=35570 RepID=UPI0027E22786|nr:uncharacterized protein LOC106081971 [Stomoxys calcitrans]
MKILCSTLVGALFCHLAAMAWTLPKDMHLQDHLRPVVRDEASAVEDDSIELPRTTTLRSTSVTSPTLTNYLYCEQEQYIHEFINESNQSQMLWVTWNRTKAGENAVLPNMCSVANGLPLRRRCYVVASLKRAQWEPHENNTVMIQCHRSMFCEEEQFEHFYIEGEDHLQPHVNVWKRTRINQKATLKDLCLKPNGLPLTRKCLYNAQSRKAQWAEIKNFQHFRCLRTTEQPIISNDLNTLLSNVSGLSTSRATDAKSRRESSRQLINLLENPHQRRLPVDIHLTNEILKGLITDFPDPELSADVLHITHNVMASEPNVLFMSAELNATNSLLDTFESYMDNIGDKFVSQGHCGNMTLYTPPPSDKNLSTAAPIVEVINTHLPIGVYAHVSGNISVFFVNPQCAGISGIAIYPSKLFAKQRNLQGVNYDSFNDFHYRFIALNESAQELLHDSDLQVAAFVPLTMWEHLLEHFSMMHRSPVLVFKVYAHDGLFVEATTMRLRKPDSKVLSISIPGYEDNNERCQQQQQQHSKSHQQQ